MKKKSLSIAGHKTSISLEQAFWDQLQIFAKTDNLSLAGLIAAIDRDRVFAPDIRNLSSALRVYVLTRALAEREK